MGWDVVKSKCQVDFPETMIPKQKSKKRRERKSKKPISECLNFYSPSLWMVIKCNIKQVEVCLRPYNTLCLFLCFASLQMVFCLEVRQMLLFQCIVFWNGHCNHLSASCFPLGETPLNLISEIILGKGGKKRILFKIIHRNNWILTTKSIGRGVGD